MRPASSSLLRRARGVLYTLGLAAVPCIVNAPSLAKACGVGGGGTSGLAACSVEEHAESLRKKWRVGGGYGFTATRLAFSAERADQTRQLALATLEYAPTSRATLQVGAGALVAGDLQIRGQDLSMTPGPLGILGGSYRVVDADGAVPFVLLTVQVSFVVTNTQGPSVPFSNGVANRPSPYRALDGRLGAVAGFPIASVVAPYALARVFGGPIQWDTAGGATGTDLYHVQLGAGVSVTLARRVDVFVEGVPLGERGVSAGAGVSF